MFKWIFKNKLLSGSNDLEFHECKDWVSNCAPIYTEVGQYKERCIGCNKYRSYDLYDGTIRDEIDFTLTDKKRALIKKYKRTQELLHQC